MENQANHDIETFDINILRQKHITLEDRDGAFSKALRRQFRTIDGKPSHLPILYAGGTEARGIAFIEPSGGGKTTTINRVLKQFEPIQMNPDTGLPRYVSLTVKSPATLRSIGVDLLEQLGVPRPADRTKVYEVWSMVKHRIQLLDISLIWFDEAQDMFRKQENGQHVPELTTEIDNIFRMLKNLMQGPNPVVVVISGTQVLSAITTLDTQIDRRLDSIVPAPLHDATDQGFITDIACKYASIAGLETKLSPEFGARLLRAGRFRLGRSIDYIISSIQTCFEVADHVLRDEHFAMRWDQKEKLPLTQNMFRSPDWQNIEFPEEIAVRQHAEQAISAASKKRRGRKRAS